MMSVVLYQCDSSCLVLSDIRLFSDWCVGTGLVCGVVVRFTCHIPAANLQLPSMNRCHLFYTLMWVAVNVTIQPSSHSIPMKISDSDWVWGKMCAVFSLVVHKGLRFSSVL